MSWCQALPTGGRCKQQGLPYLIYPWLRTEINAWAEVNVEASKREDSGSIGLQREFARDEVKECVAKLKNRKAAGADEIVNEFLKYGGEGMITMMVLLYNWIWKNEYTLKRLSLIHI